MDPSTLFKIANNGVIPFWLLLAVAPRSIITARIVLSGAVSCLIAGFYIICLLRGPGLNAETFTTLEGVRGVFADDWFLLAAWLHYLAFDLYVGASITQDYIKRGGSRIVLCIELFFTLMFGPVGLLIHKLRIRVWPRQA